MMITNTIQSIVIIIIAVIVVVIVDIVNGLEYVYENEGSMQLWMVKNFLSEEEAESLYEGMEKHWKEQSERENTRTENENENDRNKNDRNKNENENGIEFESPWLFTTNVPGQNKKIRSIDNVKERKEKAKTALKRGIFAYAKNELNRNTNEYQFAKKTMNNESLLKEVSKMVNGEITQTEDMFVSCYKHEDFLSIHQDASLGTFAFVVSLTKNWTVDDGGLLRLYCHGLSKKPCKKLVPSFNTLTVFRVRPQILDHDVSPVTSTSKNRYAITGWWYTYPDVFTPEERKTQELQRGNDYSKSKNEL